MPAADEPDDGLECQLHNIAPTAHEQDITTCLAAALHIPRYYGPDGQRMNFKCACNTRLH